MSAATAGAVLNRCSAQRASVSAPTVSGGKLPTVPRFKHYSDTNLPVPATSCSLDQTELMTHRPKLIDGVKLDCRPTYQSSCRVSRKAVTRTKTEKHVVIHRRTNPFLRYMCFLSLLRLFFALQVNHQPRTLQAFGEVHVDLFDCGHACASVRLSRGSGVFNNH